MKKLKKLKKKPSTPRPTLPAQADMSVVFQELSDGLAEHREILCRLEAAVTKLTEALAKP